MANVAGAQGGSRAAERDFHHPYTPYQIQLDLMNALYDCIQNRQIGIFESPTGLSILQRRSFVLADEYGEQRTRFLLGGHCLTALQGKSLSLLCASAAWLRDHQAAGHLDVEYEHDADEPDWVIEQARKDRREAVADRQKQITRHLAKIREKELLQKKCYETGEPPRKRMKSDRGAQSTPDDENEELFLLEDYESDSEGHSHGMTTNGSSDGLSTQTRELLLQLGMVPSATEDESVEYFEGARVFYCSRTHSQLSQLASEVRKLRIPSAVPESINGAGQEILESIKYLTLGSRKNLCINPKVNRLQSAVAINERCLQLQQSKGDAKSKCPYLPNPETEPLVHSFRDHALAQVRDIEDLAKLGKRMEICPYYASRAAIRPSELVTLPYPLLLQKAARDALEISLKDHVVIIDEAHNLIDAIGGIYSASVTIDQLKLARSQLGVYLQKFRNKVKGKNRVYLAQIIRVIDSLTTFLAERGSSSPSGTTTVPELLRSKGADQVDLYKLSTYLRESRLARKVDGYVEFTAQASKEPTAGRTSMPVLCHVESFLLALTSPSDEGKFFYERTEDQELQLKYMLLDPTFHFKDIVDEARSVILIGGTMSPMSDFIHQLFQYAEPERVRTLSCGHIIPDRNLVAWPVSNGLDGMELDFTFEKRSLPKTLDSLGKTIVAIAQVVPRGLVCFFPSYSYLDQAVRAWKSGPSRIWEQLENRKTVFTDSKSGTQFESILQSYTAAVPNGHGALLLSVVGGSMSEGINFSDDLGRGVIIIGLPFPNAQSVEWRTKMDYARQRVVARGGTAADGAAEARAMYENACMRAVNQSIGRAIRHRNDYAAIFMLDKRYGTARIQEKLPGWIKKRLPASTNGIPARQIIDKVQDFFAQPRET